MHGIRDDMQGALQEYFDEQAKLDGKCLVDFVQFDDEYEVVYQDRPVAEATAVLEPRGMTALLDALGKTINQLGEKLRNKPEAKRPGVVQVVVVTDGHENASREFTAAQVKELIAHQTDNYQWDFVYLGANQDAVTVGRNFGFDPNKSLTYDVNKVGAMSASLNAYTTNTRMAGSGAGNAFTDADRQANS